MVAFYISDQGIDFADGDFMRSMNLGDCTIIDGVLHVDYRGDNPVFTEENLRRIEESGLVRADTHWYEVMPEPLREQQGLLLRAFGNIPSTTVAPKASNQNLRLSFVKALTDQQISEIQEIGFKIVKVDTVPLRTIENAREDRFTKHFT